MSDLLVLSAPDVAQVSASFPPAELQSLMAQVFVSLSHLRALKEAQSSASSINDLNSKNKPEEYSTQVPHRTTISMENHTALFMPARLATSASSINDGTTSIKIVCVPKEGGTGLPATTLVLDEATGSVKAVVNAGKLTALRNAAGSLLSTCLVATRYPQNIVAFGAGNQIEAHLDLHIRFFPQVKRCTVINRTVNQRSKNLLSALVSRHPRVHFRLHGSMDGETWEGQNPGDAGQAPNQKSSTVEQALRAADLVICATSSTEPLFPSEWIRQGTHLILIGSYTPRMKEIGTRLIERSIPPSQAKPPSKIDLQQSAAGRKPGYPILLVDSKDSCLMEAGELIEAKLDTQQLVEIGDLVPQLESGVVNLDDLTSVLGLATRTGKTGLTGEDGKAEDTKWEWDGPVTLFKSVGVGLQDLMIAKAVVEKAKALGLGQTITNYDSA